jgi:CBS domain-containing protein
MSKDIKTIGPEATIAEARSWMRAGGVRHLLVLDRRDVVGILSERDLGGRAGADGKGIRVRDVMTKNVVTAEPDTTVRHAANLLRGHTIGCVVVSEGGKPVGIVTTTDLLELIGRGVERPIERSTRWTLRSRGARTERPTERHSRRG